MPRHFPFAPEPDSLFAGARRIAIGEAAVLTLSPVDMMLVLCVHSTKHGWMNLSNLCDIAGMVRANRDADWAEVLDKAGPIGAQRMVMLGFNLARELLGAEFPAAIARMAQDDRRVIALTRRVIRQMFLRPAERHPPLRALDGPAAFNRAGRPKSPLLLRPCIGSNQRGVQVSPAAALSASAALPDATRAAGSQAQEVPGRTLRGIGARRAREASMIVLESGSRSIWRRGRRSPP